MERSKAIEVWTRLEEARITDLEGDPPSYKVRLDAGLDDRAGERNFRVRITLTFGGTSRDEWLYVMETATEFDLEVDVQNSGMELV